jgi:hypothetical protein
VPKTLEEQAAVHQENKNLETKQQIKTEGKANTDFSLADLSHSPATQLADHFNAVQNNSTTLLHNQAEKATTGLPKVNAKTGSAFSGSKGKSKTKANKTTAKSGKKTVKSVSQKSQKEISFPQKSRLKKLIILLRQQMQREVLKSRLKASWMRLI